MSSLLDKIKQKIKQEIPLESIQLIDNSNLHKKHKFYDPKKLHLKIIIKSEELKKIDKIDAHKKIFQVLKSEMIESIHALEIEVK